MSADAATLAAELESFSLRRGLTELANCHESVVMRKQQLVFLANQARADEEQASLAAISSECQHRFEVEVRESRRNARKMIRKLEQDADEQRRRLLDEIEAANRRRIVACESIAESEAVLNRKIPDFDSARVVSESVYRKKIDGMLAMKRNLEAKRSVWREIESELESLRERAKKQSPGRQEVPPADVPVFKMSMKDIAGKKK